MDSEDIVRRWKAVVPARMVERSVPLMARSDGGFYIASGVLVNLWGTHFIFTAGHCVEAFNRLGAVTTTAEHGESAQSLALPRFVGVDCRVGDHPDAGWLELDRGAVEQLSAGIKRFVTAADITMCASEVFPPDVNHFGLSGWPVDRVRGVSGLQIVQTHVGVRMSPNVARDADVRATAPADDTDIYYNLMLPVLGWFRPFPRRGDGDSRPRLDGMSGSGLWAWSDASGLPEEVRLRLLGLVCHYYSGIAQVHETEVVHLVAVRIDCVLASIAELMPQLGARIHQRWPAVANLGGAR